MKRILTILLALCLCATLFVGCGSANTSAEATSTASTEESAESTAKVEEKTDDAPQKLVVANWKGYGADEPFGAERFEELYNCEVEFVYFNSLEELDTMMQTGGIGNVDVALPSTVYVQIFREAGMLSEIDVDKITCYGDLYPQYLNMPEATGDNGEVYALPWTWGTTSLGYNPEAVEGEVTSWDVMYEDEFAGKVAFFDDYVTAIMVGAIHTNQDPTKPETLDMDLIQEDLLALKKNVRTFWASYDDYLNPYTSGEIVIGNMWAGTATSLKNSGTPCQFVYPPEGTVGYVDMWCIFKDCPNYDLALKWLDFMCGEEFQYNFATVEGNAHNTVNNKVAAVLTDDQKALVWALESPEKVYMQPVLTSEQETAWLDCWNAVKAG